MARNEGTESSTGRGKQQQPQQQQPDTGRAAGGKRADMQGARSTEQEQRLPMGREGMQRGGALSRQQASLLPSVFSAPPDLLTGAFLSNPFGFMRRMSEEMNRIFESGAMGGPLAQFGGSEQSAAATWMPQIEIDRRGDEFVVRADLPGLKKEDVTVEVDDGVLQLSGERRQESRDEREGFYRSERNYGTFFRAIPLPEGVNEDDITASFTDGVLEVRVPVPAQKQKRGRRLEIK